MGAPPVRVSQPCRGIIKNAEQVPARHGLDATDFHTHKPRGVERNPRQRRTVLPKLLGQTRGGQSNTSPNANNGTASVSATDPHHVVGYKWNEPPNAQDAPESKKGAH